MRMVWVVLGAVGTLLAAPTAEGQGGGQPLTVSAVRFFSPASATTTIEGVCELRLGAVAASVGQVVRYRVEIAVSDSTGRELVSNGWSREVPSAVARAQGATAVETFDFRAAPGRYRLVVQVVPATGPALERALDVSAYPARPAVSDLLLATAARLVGADTDAVGAGEVQRAGVVMRTAPVPHLSPVQATLTYYAEVYPWPGASLDGQLTVAVLGAGRRSVVQTAPRAVRFSQAGGVARGSIDLAGLPAGQYVLQLGLKLGDSTVMSEAPFAMGSMSDEVAATPSTAPAVADIFENATEAGLDSMYSPLVYLLTSNETGVYDQLSVDGKRRFLREFWAKRDPTHGSGANQAMQRFYGAVQFANDAFREGGAAQIPGWRTDRGRIFLKNGRWDEILQRPMATPQPYEVWKFTRGRQRYYVFMDQSGLGHYQLIGSNDRQEPGLPNWQQMLGTESYTDVARFLGLTTENTPQ